MAMLIVNLVLVSLMLGGCLSSNLAEVMKAAGSEHANWCGAASTPYGGGVVGAVKMPGAKLNISGGQCVIETVK